MRLLDSTLRSSIWATMGSLEACVRICMIAIVDTGSHGYRGLQLEQLATFCFAISRASATRNHVDMMQQLKSRLWAVGD
jgi:hypothetical protein